MADQSSPHVSFIGRFAAMKGAAPELWVTYAIKLIAIQAYAIMNWTFVLWLSPWYAVIILYVVGLSIGETFFSPRLYEYAAAIAPKGQEASYMSLSYLPYLLAKLFVLIISGPLLASFCPADGPRDSGTMWLIIALMTVVAPVGLLALGRHIRVPEAGHESQG